MAIILVPMSHTCNVSGHLPKASATNTNKTPTTESNEEKKSDSQVQNKLAAKKLIAKLEKGVKSIMSGINGFTNKSLVYAGDEQQTE